MKKILYSILGFITLGFISSCNLDINDDPDYRAEVGSESLFNAAVVETAATLGSDCQLVGGFWSQFYTQNTTSNQYRTLDACNLTNNSYAGVWRTFYARSLADLVIAKKQAIASKNVSMASVNSIMMVFNYHILTCFYDKVPYSEALLGQEGNFEPKYEGGKVINKSLIDTLTSEIGKLTQIVSQGGYDPSLDKVLSQNDILFKGDLRKWLQFANTLKLKLVLFNPDATIADIQSVLAVDNFLTTDAKVALFDNKPFFSNPLFENDRRMLNTHNNIRASKTFVNFLIANNDPRIVNYYEKSADNDLYAGIEQGWYNNYKYTVSNTSLAKVSPNDPVYFVSEVESYFLQAEAYFKVGDAVKAEAAYNKAVKASFARVFNMNSGSAGAAYWSGDQVCDATDFIKAGGVYAYNNTLEQIMVQKWASSCRAQMWNSFFDINRTGFPKTLYKRANVAYEDASYVPGYLVISNNSTLRTVADDIKKMPRRLMIPKISSDYNTNAPVAEKINVPTWYMPTSK